MVMKKKWKDKKDVGLSRGSEVAPDTTVVERKKKKKDTTLGVYFFIMLLLLYVQCICNQSTRETATTASVKSK